MALVAFLRGVNVGAHNRFQPAVLARELAHLGAINIGAAGTFVFHSPLARTALKSELLRRLAFEADIMICESRQLRKLAFPESRGRSKLHAATQRRCVSVLASPPRRAPPLPFQFPAGALWEIRIVAIEGCFVLFDWRRTGRLFHDPNAMIEKQLGVRATTRNWNTIVRIHSALDAAVAPAQKTISSPSRTRRGGP